MYIPPSDTEYTVTWWTNLVPDRYEIWNDNNECVASGGCMMYGVHTFDSLIPSVEGRYAVLAYMDGFIGSPV